MTEHSVTEAKRILIISQYFPPDIGGSATRTKNLLKALMRKGYGVTLITAEPHYPSGPSRKHRRGFYIQERAEGADIFRLWMPPVSHHSNAGRLVNYVYFTFASCCMTLLAGPADVVFAQSPNFFVWFVGILAKILKRAPLISNVDDLWPEALEDLGVVESKRIIAILRVVRNICFRISDRIVCISSAIERFVERLGFPYPKVSTIEVGYDFDETNLQPSSSKKGVIQVLYSGILGSAYDFETLVNLAKKCQTDSRSVKLVIKGRGPELQNIRQMVRRNQLDNIEILSRWLSKQEHSRMLSETEVFVLPMKDNFISRTALPTKLIEYMANAKPIIVFGGGYVARLVREAKCGIAVEDKDLDSAMTFLENIVTHEALAKELGEKGREYALQHFSIESIGDKIDALIHDLD